MMGDVITFQRKSSPVEDARGHLQDMVGVIRSIKVYDDNSQTLRDIAEENVSLAFEILDEYLKGKSDGTN